MLIQIDNCLAACDSQPGCAAMSFDTTGCTNNCYLFSSLTGLITVQSSTSDSASFACAALRGPGPSTCDSVLTGATDFGPYQVQCGVNYIGDSSLGSITAPGYTECFNACNANSHCSAFSFDSSICSNNCKLLAYIDDLTISSSSTVSSGFTPGNARDYSCGSAICGTSVNGAGSNGDGYLVACRYAIRVSISYSTLTFHIVDLLTASHKEVTFQVRHSQPLVSEIVFCNVTITIIATICRSTRPSLKVTALCSSVVV